MPRIIGLEHDNGILVQHFRDHLPPSRGTPQLGRSEPTRKGRLILGIQLSMQESYATPGDLLRLAGIQPMNDRQRLALHPPKLKAANFNART